MANLFINSMCPSITWLCIVLVILISLFVEYNSSKEIRQKGLNASVQRQQQSDEYRLFKKMMRRYEKSVRPVHNSSQPVVIKLGITLTQIFDLDERNQVLTVNVWLDQEWKDENLGWKKEEYGGLEQVRVPCDLLWLPDIVLYNSVDDYTEQYMRSLAMVFEDGTVFWPPIVRFRSSCKVDITYFPFDDQICHMKMGSWAYDGFQVDVTNRTTEVDLSNYVNNGEWELLELRIKRNIHYYACCPQPFPDVTFWFHLRRRTTYYTFNIIIPCIILSLLSMSSFLLPAASGEKISLGLTVLLAFSVFMLLIAETMPATSEFVPLIGLYLTVIMGMTSLSVVFSVFVLHIHHKGSRGVRAPYWVRNFSYVILARVLCMRQGSKSLNGEDNDEEDKERRQHTKGLVRAHHSTSSSLVNNNSRTGNLYTNMVHSSGNFHQNTDKVSENGQISVPPYSLHYTRQSSKTETGQQQQHNYSQQQRNNSSKRNNAKWCNAQDELLSHLRVLVAKLQREEKNTQIVKEWQDIGYLLDRTLLILFTLVTVLSTIALLVLKPMNKSMDMDTVINQL